MAAAALSRAGYDVPTLSVRVLGRPFLGLNGGPAFTLNEAVSFMVLTDDQCATDCYWDAIVGSGGVESNGGWFKDRWGHSWQITPKRLMELTTGPDHDKAKCALTMCKIDIAALESASRG